MVAYFHGFRQEALIKYNISATDVFIMSWMTTFIAHAHGKIKTFTDEQGAVWFWFKYSKLLSDLPYVLKNIYQVRYAMAHLCKGPNKPLLSKLIHTRQGTDTFFRFNPIISDELFYESGQQEMSHGFDLGIQPPPAPKQPQQKHSINPNALRIFKYLTSLESQGKRIFPHEVPDDAHTHNYTNLFRQFQNTVLNLHDGRFLTDYPVANLEEWFRNKYRYYLNLDYKKEIKKCKGDWVAITNLFEKAGKNYLTWFSNDSELSDKEKLPHSINAWIYNSFNHTSMFYLCLVEGSTNQREAQAEKTYDSINPKYVKIASRLYNDDFDGYTFWNKINNVIKWYNDNAEHLINLEPSCLYWLGAGCAEFLADYVDWLMELTDGEPFLNNIGTATKTWELYLKQKSIAHEIPIKLLLRSKA